MFLGRVPGERARLKRRLQTLSGRPWSQVSRKRRVRDDKPGSTGDHQIILSKWYDFVNSPSYLLELLPDGQTPQCNVFSILGQGIAVSSVTIEAGDWVHVAGSFDKFAVKVYVNGSLAGTTGLSGPINVENQPVTIGAHCACQPSDRNWFNGLIDDVRLYDAALSQEEIEALYLS